MTPRATKIASTRREFGHMPDGREVGSWTLRGGGGLEVEVLEFGCIVRRIVLPDGGPDVVLGFGSLDGYLAKHPYFGALVGRIAGRVRDAHFSIDGREFRLAANEGAHHLHGGVTGLDKRLWFAAPVDRADGAPSVRFEYVSPDGEEGYPGEVAFAATYSVLADNSFAIETEAASDRPTPVSLTNHSYFNLGGEASADALDQTLEIAADAIVPTDESLGLTGRLVPLDGGPNDFRAPARIGDVLAGLAGRHGDVYRISGDPGSYRFAARLCLPAAGRAMEVWTDCAYLQFYTGVFLDGTSTGKSGSAYGPHAAVCLECQGYPDATRSPELDDILVRPGAPQRRRTTYRFFRT